MSVNNTTIYFIYNKNNILSGWHISNFIKSSSGSLRKYIQELPMFQCIVESQVLIIWDVTMHWNIDSSSISLPRGPEDDLIKVEICRPDNTLFLLYIVLCYSMTRIYIDFCLILLYVSAVCFSNYHSGILLHKESKVRVETFPYKQWLCDYCKIDDYYAGNEISRNML